MRMLILAESIVFRTSASAPASGENATSTDGNAHAGDENKKAMAMRNFFITTNTFL